jgi:hypothetical protein
MKIWQYMNKIHYEKEIGQNYVLFYAIFSDTLAFILAFSSPSRVYINVMHEYQA